MAIDLTKYENIRPRPTAATTTAPAPEGVSEPTAGISETDETETPTTRASTAPLAIPAPGDTSFDATKTWHADELEFTAQYGKALDDIEFKFEQMAEAQSKAPKRSSIDVWTAAFEVNNPITSFIVQAPLPQVEPIPGYSPFEDKGDGTTDITGYEEFYQSFMDSQNPATTAALKSRIDRERANQRILSNGGAEGILASIAAGLGDPINMAMMLLPLTTAPTAAKMAASSIAAGVAASATSELALHATQETRTIEDSMINVASTALLDGVLGGAAGWLKGTERKLVQEHVQQTLRHASAAQRISPLATGAEIESGPLSYLARQMVKITPLGRTLQSNNPSVRATVQELTESSIKLSGDYAPVAVETLIKLDYAKMAEATSNVRRLQRQFVKEGGDKKTFSIELTTAMRNGDTHSNALIQSAAKELRGQIDNLWERAANLRIPGTFVEEVAADGTKTIRPYRSETAPSYMTRRYDLQVVRQDPEGFKQAWIAGLKDRQVRTNAALVAEGKKPVPDLDDDKWYEIANEIYERVTDMHAGDLHFNTGPSGATMFKQRVDIADSFVDAYLVKDWESLMEGYVKSMAPRTRLAERFGEGEGGYNMSEQFRKVKESYASQISALDQKISAGDAKLIKQRDKLVEKQASDLRDLQIMRDRLLNMTQEPSWMNPENRGILSALRAARSWNIATMLSNTLISSIPDLARTITYHGAGNFVKAFTRSAFSRELRRLNMPKSDMAKMASAMERTSAYRLSMISEVEDGITYTRADKYAHMVADRVVTISGMKHWNSMQKTIAGHLIGDKIANHLLKGTGRSELKALGFTDGMYDEAVKQARRFAYDDDGLMNLNLEQWESRQLVEMMEAAAIKEADKLVVTPGVGDKPLFMTTEMGRTLGQFKSFIIAATNKMTLPLLQEKGIRPWVEILTQVGLGAAVYQLREQIAGREPSDDPKTVMIAAVENTGIAGYGLELMKMGKAVTGVDPLGKEEDSKFYARGPWGTLLGPSAQLSQNVWSSVYSETSPEQRAKAMRKLLPFQNHFLLRSIHDTIEDETTKMLGGSSDELNF